MAAFTGAEHARCVFLFEETKSATIVQHRFRTQYGKDHPSRPTIYSWHQTFVMSGCSVSHSKHTSRPRTAEAVVEQVRDSFARSPRKSTRCAKSLHNCRIWGSEPPHLHLLINRRP
ncbi:hypothetical protein L9F63_005087 [Diploptera punctata]|uniref:DUF4817 domain-containing protein n=1 Tax=Diploptera punctata TaxID=6984 RepID=A0AAD8E654_DIPPU|nr:hypothetical protein L9F63_005087 [Diploptera punctata]